MGINTLLLLLLVPHWCMSLLSFILSPVPYFRVGIFYPTRPGESAEQTEISLCRAIVDHIDRDSPRYRNELVYNTNSKISFQTADSHIMSSRMQSKLGVLEGLSNVRMTVLKAWTQFPDSELQNNESLNYEGIYTSC